MLPKVYKRPAYHHHNEKPEEIALVLNALRNCNKGEMRKIEKQTLISYNTLKDWRRKLQIDPTYDPTKKQIRATRIFTPEEEDNIATFIKENIIRPGYFFTDDDFRELIISEYLRKYNNSENIKKFNASNGYIFHFKEKNKISSRKCHIRRRPIKGTCEETFVNQIEN